MSKTKNKILIKIEKLQNGIANREELLNSNIEQCEQEAIIAEIREFEEEIEELKEMI